MFRLQGFSLEGSEKEGAWRIYNNLFCTCHFNVCLLPLWHSTRAFETQESGKEYILKELLINSSLGLLSRKRWECLWLFLKGSSTKAIFFSGYHKSRIEEGKKPQTGNFSNSAGNLTHQSLKKHSNAGFYFPN